MRGAYIHTDVCPIIFVPGVTIEVKNILERMSDDVSVEDDKSIQWQVESIEVHKLEFDIWDSLSNFCQNIHYCALNNIDMKAIECIHILGVFLFDACFEIYLKESASLVS